MKKLFIGNYLDGNNGWSLAARDYIEALDDGNLNIRPFCYAKPSVTRTERQAQLESNPIGDYDVVIQMVLPHDMIKISGVRCIGIFFSEVDNFCNNQLWKDRLSSMDEVWVSTERELRECERNGIKAFLVRQPIKHPNLEPKVSLLPAKDSYRFYYIGDTNGRKRLPQVIHAYATVKAELRCSLVIKSGPADLINNLLQTTQQALKLKLSDIHIIADDVTEDHLDSIHRDCDCLVLPSAEECVSRVAVQAARFGNKIVAAANTSVLDGVNYQGLYLADSVTDYVSLTDMPIGQVYNGAQTWRRSTVISVAEQMLKAANTENCDPLSPGKYSIENTKEYLACLLDQSTTSPQTA